jgi:ribulose-5-phosphate 4-epimerase/fuculose-1-phosphate aldolase
MLIELRDPHRPSGPPLPSLDPRVIFALLARCLHREGYDDHVNGHLSWKQPDGEFLVDARGISWDLLRPDDVVRMSSDGTVVDGRWGITPALALHLELHRRRDDIGVVIHHHSRYGTVWASACRIPPAYDQTSALLEGGIGLYARYDGSVGEPDAARLAAEAIGDAGCALLGHHGVVVTGRDPAHAFQRAVHLEHRCRIAWHVEALSGGASSMEATEVESLGQLYAGRDFPELFAAMAQRVLRDDASLVEGAP